MYDTSKMEQLDGGFFLSGDKRVYTPSGMPFCKVPHKISNHHKWWGQVILNAVPMQGAFLGCDHYELYFDCVKDLALGNAVMEFAHGEFSLDGKRLQPGDVIEVRQIIRIPHDPMGHCRGPWHKVDIDKHNVATGMHPANGLWSVWCSGPTCHLWGELCPEIDVARCRSKCVKVKTSATLTSLKWNYFCRWPVGE